MTFRKIRFHLIPLLFAAAIGYAQDTVVLNNGDILTGKILEQTADHIYFKSTAFGSVSLNPKDIAEIRINIEELGEFTVPTEVISPDKPVVESPVVPKVAKKTHSPKAKTKATKMKQWSGQAGLAVALRESNTLRRQGDKLVEKDEEFESYRVYGNVKWKGEINKLDWNWTYRYSRTDVRVNDDFLNLTQNYQHDFSKKYYAAAKSLYQRDFRRGIENEYLQTAELGVKWFESPKFKFSTSVGAGYHNYERLQNKYSDAKTKFILEESIRWQMINSLTLFQKYSHLGDVKDYHFVFTSGLENKLIRDVFLRLEYRLDRDTEVNYDDKSYYDKALLTSLLYKF
jgi:hypothetical protein